MTSHTLNAPEVLVTGPDGHAPDAGSRHGRPTLPSESPAPLYVGVALALVGMVLIAIAWGQVAAETDVALQMPYLLSGGLIGLAFVLIGLTVVNIASRRRDTALREEQTQLLADALSELRAALENDGRR